MIVGGWTGLGLSSTQQALYESLLARPDEVAAEVAATDDFARLAALGLVTRVSERSPFWTVVPPEVAIEPLVSELRGSLREERRRVARMAELFQRAATVDDADLIEIRQGREQIQDAFAQVLAEAKDELIACDAPPYATSPSVATCGQTPLERGVRLRTLFDRKSIVPGKLQYLAETMAVGEQIRIIDVPMKMVIADGKQGLIPLRLGTPTLESVLVVHHPALLTALTALFESYWERAVPLDLGHGNDGPSELERDLLALMMSGLTDAEIAAHMHCHVGTVRRHLSQLFERLDATTRFQAGYQAVRLGWLTPDVADLVGAP